MKYKFVVIAIVGLLFLTHNLAFADADEEPGFTKWVASCEVDRFTDDQTCQNSIFTISEDIFYGISFMINPSNQDGNIYGFHFYDTSKYNFCQNYNVIRVDKYEAIYFENRIINGNKARKLLEQMLVGKTVIARCGTRDFDFTLNGFRDGYKFVISNMAFDPLKN